MLNPEEATERLQSLKLEDPKSRRMERIAALPMLQREIAYGLFGLLPDGTDPDKWQEKGLDWEEIIRTQQVVARLQEEAWERLHALEEPERRSLLAGLFPKLDAHVARAWSLFERLPYQAGYGRKAFRVRNAPANAHPARKEWFTHLLQATQGYEQDVAWYAAWAPYLGWQADTLGILFAAAMEGGGEEGEKVFDILLASARGEHEIGAMGRHVTRALLVAYRPDGWTFVEKLLLAALREEGLRQAILETVDEAHPEAFRRMLRLIVDNDLLRFSSTMRAICVWLGLDAESMSVPLGNRALLQITRYLEDPSARDAALCGEDSSLRYVALWALACEDAYTAISLAAQMLKEENVEHRLVAVRMLKLLGLPEAKMALMPALDDADLHVAELAFTMFQNRYGFEQTLEHSDLFERLERLFTRVPKERKSEIAGVLVYLIGDRSSRRLLPYLSSMDSHARYVAAMILANPKKIDAEIRAALFVLVGDISFAVRAEVIKAIKTLEVTEPEWIHIEKLLTRKASDLRRDMLSLLLGREDSSALTSAKRLLAAREAGRRLAGLEMLREMAKANRAPDRCRAIAMQYRQERPDRADAEEELIAAFVDPEREAPTLRNGLGLFDPAHCTPSVAPRAIEGVVTFTPANIALLEALDDLIHAHRETPVRVETWRPEELLGNIRWGFPWPQSATPLEEDLARLPLREVWENWWNVRPANLSDPDGLDLLRVLGTPDAEDDEKANSRLTFAQRIEKLQGQTSDDKEQKIRNRYPSIRNAVLLWLLRMYLPENAVDCLLDAVENQFTKIPIPLLEHVPESGRAYYGGWRSSSGWTSWLSLARTHRSFAPHAWTDAHHVRLWSLLRWMDKPNSLVPRYRPYLEEALAAHRAGGATEADLLDLLLGAEDGDDRGFGDLERHSGRKTQPLQERYPILRDLVDRCRKRIVEVELGRGEMDTAATNAAMALHWTGGMETLIRGLQVYPTGPLLRGSRYSSERNRGLVLSELIRRTVPGAEETPEQFAERARAAKLSSKRLVDAAVYAPQWARHIGCALGWEGLEEAVWWIHAHTKDTQWGVETEIRETWKAEVSERAPLSAEDLLEGAVDVAWFHRAYRGLGPEPWTLIDGAARYASGGGGHKRAQLFADAMLGRTDKETLVTRIREKRQQDAVRALGLLPLAEGAERGRDLLDRYKTLQEFVRTSRQFGSQRQESEKLAARIGMDNLARTAGYPDPMRLQWAMEMEAVADLAKGPVTVEAGDVAVSLRIDDFGKPEITITNQGKPIKAVPVSLKKETSVVELQARKREIERQVSRMRQSLEQAMCRGDQFTGAELRTLMGHPVLAPMLRSLVFLGDGLAGYPVEGGAALESHDGTSRPVPETAALVVAHPHDLLQTGAWPQWQRGCFLRERIQPFKQVFRELYVRTESETPDGCHSRRYDGHQVQPKQALALLGSRGWVVHPEEGVRRTFHDEGLTAWIEFFEGYFTPAEVEGLTIESVGFAQRGDWKRLPLEQVPPRVFSEVMRDLDLVVSVAHQGGVDPEASMSTVEMRTSLLREACALLKLENVRLNDSHALIDGHLGTYSVHLGSAVVHRQPGGHLCIVPVHSQHRGRLFLPFADDDPKTAEVLSKVLLLSKDKEIKDPSILEQILPRSR